MKSQEYPPEFFDGKRSDIHKDDGPDMTITSPSSLPLSPIECRTFLIGVGILTKDERGLLALEKEATSMSRFLNRILGLPVKLQNQLFAYFSDTLSYIIQQARRMGRWDSGILGWCSSFSRLEY